MTLTESARTAAAIVLSLAALEVILRFAFAFPPVARRLVANDDLSYRRAWVQRQREPLDPPRRVDVYDPVLGWRPRPDMEISPIWNGKTLTTNAQGFRSMRDYGADKPPSMTRILALGDSFTFGEEVGDDEIWTHHLDEMCPQLEVFNLGVHGYGFDQMLLLLRETAREYAPDIVLLGYIKTDMYRSLLAFRDYAKPRFRLADGDLELVDIPVPVPEVLLEHDPWRPRLLDLGLLVSTRFQSIVGIRTLRKRRLTGSILEEIARFSLHVGARPVFAYFPYGREFDSSELVREREDFFWEVCGGIEGVSCLSVSENLRRAASTETECCQVPGGYHWSARAHLLAAQSLMRSLLDEGLIEGCFEPSLIGSAPASHLLPDGYRDLPEHLNATE